MPLQISTRLYYSKTNASFPTAWLAFANGLAHVINTKSSSWCCCQAFHFNLKSGRTSMSWRGTFKAQTCPNNAKHTQTGSNRTTFWNSDRQAQAQGYSLCWGSHTGLAIAGHIRCDMHQGILSVKCAPHPNLGEEGFGYEWFARLQSFGPSWTVARVRGSGWHLELYCDIATCKAFLSFSPVCLGPGQGGGALEYALLPWSPQLH